MSRKIYPFEPTWLDREYRKNFAQLAPTEQEQTKQDLASLISALGECHHPTMDPLLGRWKPSSYGGLGVPGLYEYRLGPLSRVIVRCTDVAQSGDILLVAATLVHDHERIKRLIAVHKQGLSRAPGSTGRRADG